MIFKHIDQQWVDEMHAIEMSSAEHPMSRAMLASCFGSLYQVIGAFEQNEQPSTSTKLVGFAVVHQVLDEATLMDICVAASAQGKGVGAALLKFVIGELASNEAAILMLEVRGSNQTAIGLYQKNGFEVVGTRRNYYRTPSGTEDAILMQLPIKNSAQ